MATNAKSAFGAILTWNGNEIAELTEIVPPETELTMQEVTNNDSAGWVEKIPGLLSSGEFSVTGNFIPGDTGGQVALQADHFSKTARTAVISLPSVFGTTYSMTAYCTKFKLETPQDGSAASFTATFELTGAPTLTIAASAGLTTPFFTVSSGSVIPAAAADVYNYVVNVETGVSSITVTPTASAGTITVDGIVVASGEASSGIALGAAGSITRVTIVVTETDKAPKTYILNIARASS